MASSNDGGPAFPGADPKDFPGIQGGMTLRDYFAAAALTGILAREGVKLDASNFYPIAVNVYQVADSLISERNRNHAAKPSE